MPLNKSRLGKIEHQLHELTGQEEDAAVLAQRQQWHYQELCYRLGCEPAEIDFQEYVKIWWESTYLTWWVQQAAPDWALCAWVQQHCQCLYPALTRFLENAPYRFVDPLWILQHDLLHNDSKYSYPHFLRTLTHACYGTWPALADRWPTLDNDACFMALQAWLTVYDPEACEWDETATDEQKLESLAEVLKHLHEEYRDQVLYACYNWKPGMVYPYKGDPEYPLQPSGSGIAGPNVVGFHGMGERVEPVEDSAGAWQDHCARLLAQRWAEQAEPEAMGIDVLDWLAQGDEEDDSVFS